MSTFRILRALWRIAVALGALAGLLALLTGVPWGLWHFIGWPLPDHLPTWAEVQATLSGPLTDTLLLNLLALIAWPLWLTFAVDVARCVPEAIRGIRPVPTGPIHAVAALLVSASILSLFGPSADHARPAPPGGLDQQGPVTHVPVAVAAHEAQSVADDGTVTVQPPHHGIHDSLWRIAQRELGDGTRWPEIYQANKGTPQADGRALHDPNLIHPGWILHLPEQSSAHEPTPAKPKTDSGSKDSASPDEAPTPPPTDTPPPDDRPVTESPDSGLDLVTGAFLSTALAAVITAGMLAIRRNRERAYRPGSGDRRPPSPLPPVVRALRIADDQRHLDLLEAETSRKQTPPATHDDVRRTDAVDIGVREGRAQAVHLATLHGLGLTGPGAEAAARALLLHLLATTTAQLIIPAQDVAALLGDDLPTSRRLHVAPNLDAATDALAKTMATEPCPELKAVLFAGVDRPDRTLQSVVDNGSDHGVAAVLLGPWPAGATVRVRGDGLVTAASPDIDDDLHGTRLFHADASDTRDIVELLASATDDPELAGAGNNVPRPRASGNGEASNPSGGEAGPATQPREAPPRPLIDVPGETMDCPWLLSVFGHIELIWKPGSGEPVVAPLSPKHRELITFLAVHPSGTSRDAVREALWPDATGKRPFNAFYATLSQIRKALDGCSDGQGDDLIVHSGDRIALNRDAVSVDYWEMADADRARRIATTDADRVAAWERIVAAYTAKIDLDIRPLWLDGPREEAHRTAVDALSALAAHCRDADPYRRLQLLEHARMLNPENEAIYREIIETQATLGLTDAISRTIGLLTHTLAETGQRPSTDILLRARELQRPTGAGTTQRSEDMQH